MDFTGRLKRMLAEQRASRAQQREQRDQQLRQTLAALFRRGEDQGQRNPDGTRRR